VSPSKNGAVIVAKQTAFLPIMPLNVEQNQTAILLLPDLGQETSFKITSQQKFSAEIVGNQLIVVASNVPNGIYFLTFNKVPEGNEYKVKVEVLTSVKTFDADQQPSY
jgi:hypothetical protein